jgi:hypothetical protein
VRDWIVLSALIAEPGRTQLALGHAPGQPRSAGPKTRPGR